MMLGPWQHMLVIWILIVVLPPAIGRNGLSALMRSHSLPLIRTLLDHGSLIPGMSVKHDLSLQHLRFMLALYKRSADGDGRPKINRPGGSAVRLVRPVHPASFIAKEQSQMQNLEFNLHNVKELMRATVMHPWALRFGDNNYYFCSVELLPSAGAYLKTRVPPGIQTWAETDITPHIKPLVENSNLTLNLQLICKHIGKPIRVPLAVSASHIPFLLIYFNHTFHNRAKEKTVTEVPEAGMSGILVRKPRQSGTIGIKLPKIPNQSGQSKNHCALHPFWVSFHQLGWDHWIIAPHRYNPGYCKGDCPRLLHSGYNSPNHAIIQNFINLVVDWNVPRPSCVPYSYSPISVLMIEPGGSILYKEYENMMAESCTCR
ncbi:bone morphogenetic protein 15 [Pseudophryne corroboree]|uniref:bone morphogenetic protein 15 n=1 Tax=Pseudophryne corroboree TaxID=495146 RepID=UPI003081B69A